MGLSPRVRGNRSRGSLELRNRRSIPACAGEPAAPSAGTAIETVYPRVCGGTRASAADARQIWGLSPRVRGNRVSCRTVLTAPGSIPACAGEPFAALLVYRLFGVYPRVCGGTPRHTSAMATASGLSPRVRGNRQRTRNVTIFARSIPACAGEPPAPACWAGTRRVYPRVCGGTGRGGTVERETNGLSPRVRGNLMQVGGYFLPVRSIPACAGEPQLAARVNPAPAVYPRVCGGTPPYRTTGRQANGLSPRVRGNLLQPLHQVSISGSIPACAGEPACGVIVPVLVKVYPRVCGGTRRGAAALLGHNGLSPRVRGNRQVVVRRRVKLGSIPACAGEPGYNPGW